VRENSWRVFLQGGNEKGELRRRKNGQGQTHLPEFGFDGGEIIFYSRNREGVKGEEMKKRKKNRKRNVRKGSMKVKTEKGQSDTGQTKRSLSGGPES
jgi:hypothetical protein